MKHTQILSCAALLLLCALSTARADVRAQVLLPGNNQPVNVELRWKPVDKEYVVTRRGSGGQMSEQNRKADEIRVLRVAEPDNWKQIQATLRSSPASALAALQKVATDYRMLMWDAEAGRIMGQIYLQQGKPEEALKAMASVAQANPDAGWNSSMAPVYWQAMIDAKRTRQLPALLERAAAADDRSIAAAAMIRRGDLIESEGRTRDALRDGYLRAVFLFADQADQRPEALYKAANAFDKLRQTAYAERMRTTLRQNYGSSSWAKRLDSGR